MKWKSINELRQRMLKSKWFATISDWLATGGVVFGITGCYMIFDGGVYLVSGDGIVPAYSFTKTSLIGLFTILLSMASITVANRWAILHVDAKLESGDY